MELIRCSNGKINPVVQGHMYVLEQSRSLIRVPANQGYTFIELVIVVCLIALLFAFSAVQYQKRISDSRKEVLYFQSQAFKRAIDNVRAISTLQNSDVVDLGTGVAAYLYRSKWPYAAQVKGNIPVKLPSQKNCHSLWFHLFSSHPLQNDNSSTKRTDDFEILLIDNYICRYKQVWEQEESYFFDYDVRTGKVVASSSEG